MFVHILLLSSFGLTYEFLLTNTTGVSSGGSGGASLTDSHYLLLMDLIGVQKQSMAKMESFVLGLQGKVNSLESDNSVLKRQNALLNKQIADISNVTFSLKGELNIFKHSSTGSDILNFTTLHSDVNVMNSQMMAMNTEIARLSSNANARGQDFIALYHQMNEVFGKIKSLNQTTTSFQNIATDDLIDVHTSIHELNQTENESKKQIRTIQLTETQMSSDIHTIKRQITDINKIVALTACGSTSPTYNSGSLAKFSEIKTSIGITDESHFKTTGYFTCKTTGVYLFSVFISYSGDYDGYSYMRKNSADISKVVCIYQTKTDHRPTTNHHTGSGTMIVHLNVGDTLSVKIGTSDFDFVGGESCFTVMKLK